MMMSPLAYLVHAQTCDEYVASSSFLHSQHWVNKPRNTYTDEAGYGYYTSELVSYHSSQPTKVIMVGTVSRNKLQCSPIHTFDGSHTLQDTQYNLILKQPVNPFFATEYHVAREHLSFVQTIESPDIPPLSLLVRDGLN
jgi:hypothetical protein